MSDTRSWTDPDGLEVGSHPLLIAAVVLAVVLAVALLGHLDRQCMERAGDRAEAVEFCKDLNR